MKKFLGYFSDYHKNYFSFRLFISVLAFIAVLIALNYRFDFEDSYIDSFRGRPLRILLYFAVHAIAYFGVILIIYLFDRSKKLTLSFWLKSILAFFIIAVDRSIFPNLSHWLLSDLPSKTIVFIGKLLNNSYGLVTIVVVLAIVQFIFDRNRNEGLYGLRLSKVDFKSYFVLLLFMVPIIYCASLTSDFANYYPTYRRSGGALFASFYDIPEYISKLIYEIFYIADFLNTELFFRGFLIIGLSRLLGKDVVLPMVATYAVLHFGKPIGETISSVFGGYILGVIALYSRNIWGGVFLHGGIALLMEIFAFIRM